MTNREHVMILAKMYWAGSRDASEYEKADLIPSKVQKTSNKEEFGHIEFFTVGRNSSHDFSLGVDALDNVYYRAFACWFDDNDPEKDVIDEHIHKVTKPLGELYMGHW